MMKKFVLCLIAVIALVSVASAAEQMLTATITDVVVASDKNGNEYVRLIIAEPKDLDGVTYVSSTAVMCFRETAAMAKTLKKGDKLKAIVQPNEYQGRTSYRLVAWPTK